MNNFKKCNVAGCLEEKALVDYHGNLFCSKHLPVISSIYVHKLDLVFLNAYLKKPVSIVNVFDYAYAFRGITQRRAQHILNVAKSEGINIDIQKCFALKNADIKDRNLFNQANTNFLN